MPAGEAEDTEPAIRCLLANKPGLHRHLVQSRERDAGIVVANSAGIRADAGNFGVARRRHRPDESSGLAVQERLEHGHSAGDVVERELRIRRVIRQFLADLPDQGEMGLLDGGGVPRKLVVTSPGMRDGKTTFTINIATSLSRSGHKLLLVDGDLRKQSIHQYLGCAGEKGLIDYLADGAPLQELITWPGIEKITLISGGRLHHESSEILGSPRMKELISDMKGRYPDRYLIIDAPPVLTGADVLTLAPLVDQVIVVVHAGVTSLDDVKQAVQYLPREKILGFVLNRSSTDHAKYYSEYYYGNKKQR